MTESGATKSLHKALLDLFLIDQKVRGLSGRLDSAKRYAKGQEAKMTNLRQQQEEAQNQLKQVQTHIRSLETDADAAEQRINQLREQMNNVHTNKEYSALLVEVNTLKVDKGKIEEQALQYMTEAERLTDQVSRLNEQIDEQQKVLDAAYRDLEARRNEVGQQLDDAQAQRDDTAKFVSPEALAVFDRMAEQHDGEAMARVEEEDVRRMEYTCGGCYMTLPPELVNQLMTQDSLVQCVNCRRILYVKSEAKAGKN